MALRALIAIIVVGLAGGYARELSGSRVFSETVPDFTGLPAAVDGWQSEDYPITESISEVLDADAVLQRRYFAPDGSEVWLFLAYFAAQGVNSQIHSPRHCVPGSGWRIASVERCTLDLPRGSHPATRLIIQRQGQGQANEMLYWFRTRSGVVTGEYSLKWDLVKNSLARRPTDAVFVRFTGAGEHSPRLRSLMATLDDPLSRILEQVGL
jgi:EpsI family protein